jgi:recombination protein RecT
MYRIQLGIDALLDGFLYPIPYLNSRTRLYDLDLRVGYKGKDFYRRGMALDPPVDIRYELVHETDQFTIRKKSFTNPVEDIDFEVPKPFNRSQVVGGFAHIIYKDKTKNQVILVTNEDFEKSKAKAQADNFWRDYPNEMKFKTIVNRATSKLIMDPKKVNAALFAVEYQDELSDAGRAQAEIDQVANKGTMLTMTQEGSTDGPSNEPEKTGAEPGSETIDMIKCPAKNNAEVPASDCPPCKDRPGCPSHESMDDTAGSTPAGETTEQGTQPASDQDKTKRAPGY